MLHDLSHEISHGLCGLVLDLSGGVGVGAEGEACVVVAQHTADPFDVHAVLEGYCGEGVTKLVEATNGYFLVEAENEIWYDIASGYGFCRSLFY